MNLCACFNMHIGRESYLCHFVFFQLLDLMKETRLYFMDVANALSVLLVHGYDDAAFAVYKLIQPMKADGHGRVLLKTMIQLERVSVFKSRCMFLDTFIQFEMLAL